MATGKIANVDVKGIACCLPTTLSHNNDYCGQFGAETVERFIQMTGVKSKYRTKLEQCASDLVHAASQKLLTELDWDPASVRGLVFFTQAPDYRKPSTACILQHRLGLSRETLSFDVNLGCSSFVYGIMMCGQLMQSNDIDRMLLLIGDTQVRFSSPHDHSARMLMGEGGAAVALERRKDADAGATIRYSLCTDGSRFKSLYVPAGAARNLLSANAERRDQYGDGILRSDFDHFMNGLDIFEFTMAQVPKSIKEFLSHFDLDMEIFDYCLLHQANKVIVEKVARKLKVPMEKVPMNVERFGNCGGVSIPLLIVDQLKKAVSGGKNRLLVSGFGVGLSWGVMDLTLDRILVPDLLFSDEYFAEG